ncbi:MAG: glycosyltransferase family 2 protein [Lacibacter sp.]
MAKLSVIIVNYNVKYFLEQCLLSVQKAAAGINTEVFVVDNNSTDDSRLYLEHRFSSVRFIWNKENIGFSRACNLGLKYSTGEFVLFLNPDTIVPENCFTDCISFLEAKKDAGALGIRMIDGSGNFLHESKRSFPSPLTSFYKLSGLSSLFPRSPRFSRYHLGYLNEHENHEIDVMAGAFMLIKKEVLDRIGGFDESFFMYGEDIDLSYRIQQAGYKNIYYSGCSIIHFKGESTKKATVNYVQMFYKAMSRFVQKHYSSSSAGVFKLFINVAIFIRAMLSVMKRFIQQTGLPVLDAFFIFLSFWGARFVWMQYIKPETTYSGLLLPVSFGGFTLLFLAVSYYTGLYEKKFRYRSLWRATVLSLIINLAVYSLLPEQFRFSRGMIVTGSLFSYILLTVWRWILLSANVLKKAEDVLFSAVAGTQNDMDNVNGLLKKSGSSNTVQAFISPVSEEHSLGNINELRNILQNTPVKKLILCESEHLSFQEIIDLYQLAGKKVKLRLHAYGSESIIGSDSKNEAGRVLNTKQYRLAQTINLRLKRLIDVLSSLFLVLVFPAHFIFNKHPFTLLRNSLLVLTGKKTWVGFSANRTGLPVLKPSILGASGVPHGEAELNTEALLLADEWYAKEYEAVLDLKTILFNYKKLGSK